MSEGQRGLGTDAGGDINLQGQTVNARLYGLDLGKGNAGILAAIYESFANFNSLLGVTQERESGFFDSLLGRRQMFTLPGATNVTGTTTHTTTAPQVILVAGAANTLVIKRIRVTLVAAAGAVPARVHVKADNVNRFSAGGTTRVVSCMDTAYAVTNGQTHAEARDGAITATAEGAGTREIGEKGIINVSGNFVEFEFKDGLILSDDGSLLIYVQGGTSAPTFTYEIEYTDVDLH